MSMPATTPAVGSGLQNNTTTRSTDDEPESWVETTEPRITFLALFILCGLLGNICLIVTICQSRRFRTTAFYAFVINLAVVNLCECLLNMVIVLSTSIKSEFDYGDLACSMNSFFINFIAIETMLGLTIIASDRMVATRYRQKYEHVVSKPRITILIFYTWFQALAFSIPIAIGVVKTSVYANLYYCTLQAGFTVVYSSFTALFCYVVPIAISVWCYVNIIRTGYKERFVVRALIAQHNYNEDPHEEPRIRKEIRYSKLSGTLSIAWVIFEGPYLLTENFRQFRDSSEIENGKDNSLEYAWHVDVVLLWLRFGYTVILPLSAFLWSKDLWKDFKDMVLCRKNNSVIDASSKKREIEASPIEKTLKEEVKQVFAPTKEQRVFQVPVLFATSHGVHIKTSSETDVSESEESSGKIRGRKCDVVGSRENINALEDDTSDYDSGNELDPFSMSHPISVKQLKDENQLTSQKRSASQPEVRNKSASMSNSTVASISAGDSGLDVRSENSCSRNFSRSLSVPYEKIPTGTHVEKGLTDKTVSNDPGVLGENNTLSAETDNRRTHIPVDEDDIDQNPNQETQSNLLNQQSKHSPVKDTTKVSRIGDTDNTEIQPDNLLYKSDTVTTVICKAEIFSETSITQNNTESIADDNPNQPEVAASPVPRRKKKKRREKLDDCRSNASGSQTNSPMLPPRPPPRLAPITSTINKLLYSNNLRPGSSCSSLCSILDNNSENIHYPYTHLDTPSCSSADTCNDSDTATCDQTHVPSSNEDNTTETNNYIVTMNDAADEHKSNNIPEGNRNSLKLDFKREMSTVQEEIISPSDCYMTDILQTYAQPNAIGNIRDKSEAHTDASVTTGVINQGYISSGEDESALKHGSDVSNEPSSGSEIKTDTTHSNEEDAVTLLHQ